MNKIIIIFVSAFVLGGGTFCSNAQQPTSVETKKPNADYKPAFAGQTRITAVVSKTPYESKIITSSLTRPWGIAALPDGRFLVTEIEGTLRIVTGSGAIGEPVKGVPKVYSAGQGGLLGICIDPAFTTNRMIYWAFSEPIGEESVTSVAKGTLSADEKSLENVAVIYRAEPSYKGSLHFGGRVLAAKDGSLFLSTGERSDKVTRPQAQDLNSGLGKIIRITKDGKPAPGNPFTGKAGARPEIYSYGHRNVQGISFHPATGELWEAVIFSG